MPDFISNITNRVIYWNTVWMIVLSVLIFLVLYLFINLLLKKLDSLNEKDSEKKRIQFLSKIMNKFPRWIFVVIEIYIAISFLTFSPKISTSAYNPVSVKKS